MTGRRYLLDANVFIEAENRHYGFGICPGFWKLIEHHANITLVSVKPIRGELETEALIDWAKHRVPDTFFREVDAPEVVAEYGKMMQWVMTNPRFFRQAKEKFAGEADCWLAAYAKVHGSEWVVVTEEEYAPDVKRKVPLPNLCREFGIEYMDTVAMVKELCGVFDWNAPELTPQERFLRLPPGAQGEVFFEETRPVVKNCATNPDEVIPDIDDDAESPDSQPR